MANNPAVEQGWWYVPLLGAHDCREGWSALQVVDFVAPAIARLARPHPARERIDKALPLFR